MDTKEKLCIFNSQDSLSKESESIGVYNLDCKDGRKYDSITEDFLSAEHDDLKKNSERIEYKIPSLNTNNTEFSYRDKTLSLKGSEITMHSECSLERAATLAEGIRTLGKSQEENWKKMNDLITKKDNLIKQMTDIMVSCKTKMSPSNESLRKGNRKQNFSSPFNSINMNLIPEKDTSDLWDPDDSLLVLGDLTVDDISEVSLDDLSDTPILDVPFGYGDEDSGAENEEADKDFETTHPLRVPVIENGM